MDIAAPSVVWSGSGTLVMILVSLALFRFFDIFKPFGIRWMEKLPRGYGMMADDVLAAIYSVVVLIVINYFILHQ